MKLIVKDLKFQETSEILLKHFRKHRKKSW